MRRKTKQLLATGMALAVLAVGAVSASAAVSAQTADAAQPQSVEDVDEYAKHDYTKLVDSGWDGPVWRGGPATPWVKLQCKDCRKTKTDYGLPVSPEHTSATCTKNETYTYSAEIKGYTVSQKVVEIANTKKDHNYTGISWEKGTADEHGYGTMTLTLTCKDCKYEYTETVRANSNSYTAAKCGVNAKYTYAADSFQTMVNGKRYAYNEEIELEVPGTALEHSFKNYVYNNDATCTKDGTKTATCDRDHCSATNTVTVEGSKLNHNYGNMDNNNVTFNFSEDGKTAVATVTCVRAGCTASEDGHTYTADAVVTSKVTKPATCTEMGETTYTATYENASATKTVVDVPALGHSFTDYRYDNNATCEGDGSQTATCDRCDATDTKSVPGSAACTLHEVDNAKVCPICGKVNGTVKLNKVSAAADDSASVYSAQLIVRVGTLPNGRKIITVTFLNAEGQAITLYDAQKIRVSLAALNAQLGETGAQSFAHTLTSLNTANGEKSNVGFAVENGTLIFDAPFQSSNACVLLVD